MLGIVYTKIKSEKCYICGAPTIRGWVFCQKCVPVHGSVVELPYPNHDKVLFVGRMGLYDICINRIDWNIDYEIKKEIGRITVIKWWMGTDALLLNESPPGINKLRVLAHRLKYRVVNETVDTHWAVSERVADNLVKFGVKEGNILIVEHPPTNQTKLDSEVFVVGYYLPEERRDQKYKDWVYGKDIIEELIDSYKNTSVTFFRYTGRESISFLNVIDCFIRPSRSDGMPRIILKCRVEGIPSLMCSDGNPKAVDFKNFIDYVIEENEDNWRNRVWNSN